MRYKSWPYYEDWQVLFGKDRANGENAEDILDASNALDDDITTGDDIGFDDGVSLEDMAENEAASDGISHSVNRRASPIPKPKKSKMAAEISGIKEVLGEIGKKTDERLATLAEGIGYEAQLGKARKGAFEQLGRIGTLSIDDRFDVCEILGKERDKLEIFMGLPDSALPLFVARLLRNKGCTTSAA